LPDTDPVKLLLLTALSVIYRFFLLILSVSTDWLCYWKSSIIWT